MISYDTYDFRATFRTKRRQRNGNQPTSFYCRFPLFDEKFGHMTSRHAEVFISHLKSNWVLFFLLGIELFIWMVGYFIALFIAGFALLKCLLFKLLLPMVVKIKKTHHESDKSKMKTTSCHTRRKCLTTSIFLNGHEWKHLGYIWVFDVVCVCGGGIYIPLFANFLPYPDKSWGGSRKH